MRRHDEGSDGLAHGRRTLALAVALSCALADVAAAAPPELDGEDTDASEAGDEDEQDDASEAETEASPDPAPPEEPVTAKDWYARGYELATAEDYLGAAEAFMRSFELQPTPEALFNVAFAYENAGEHLRAVQTYEDYAEFVGPDSDDAEQARRSIAAIMPKLAVLKGFRYTPSRPPATITVNGEAHTLEDFPIVLEPGSFELEVTDADGDSGVERYELAAGESLVVDLRALLPAKTVPEPIIDRPPEPDDERITGERRAADLRVATWIGLGLTGATGVAAIVTGSLTVVERDRFNAATCVDSGVCPGADDPDQAPPGDPEAHLRAFENYRLATNVLVGVSAGLAVGTLVVGLLALRSKRELERRRARGDDAARLRLRPSFGGLRLEF